MAAIISNSIDWMTSLQKFVNNKMLTALVPVGAFGVYTLCRRLVSKKKKSKEEQINLAALYEFYGGTLAVSTAFETVVYYLDLRNGEGAMVPLLVNASHALIPYLVHRYIDQKYPKSKLQKEADTRKKFTSQIRGLFRNSYLWTSLLAVGALQVSTRLILPYLASHEDRYQNTFVTRKLIGVYKITQTHLYGDVLGRSVQSASNSIFNSLLNELAMNATFILMAYVEDDTWRYFLKNRLKSANVGTLQYSLMSGFMWSSWRLSVFMQGKSIRFFEDTKRSVTKGLLALAISGPIFSYLEQSTENSLWYWILFVIARRVLYWRVNHWQTPGAPAN